jgi:hypothetical protein
MIPRPEAFEVEMLLSGARVRGWLRGHQFNRLSDLLQNLHEQYVTLYDASAKPLQPTGREWQATELQVARNEILLVIPTDSGGISDPSETIPKVQIAVELMVGPWQVAGNIHTLDRIHPLDFLLAAHGRFFPITEAEIRAADGSARKAPLVLPNGERIFAFSQRATG